MTEEVTATTEEISAEMNGAIAPDRLDELKPKMKITGTVQRLELYGAFIDIGLDTNAILHISQLGERVNRISDVLQVGEEVTVWVDKVDPQRSQLTVTMIEPLAVEWRDLKEGQVYTGTVTRLENFGAFVDIGAEKEGLVHISELSHEFVKHPSEVIKVGDEVQVRVLGFSKRKRRIDLSMKALLETSQEATFSEPEPAPEFGDEDEDMPTAMEIALREAMGDRLGKADRRHKFAKKRRRRERVRSKQEDIISRTLRLSQETDS